MAMKSTWTPLGDLERAVMEHLWDAGEGDVRRVHQFVGRERRITSNTVQSTLQRLHQKGLLDRSKVSHAYVYAPRVDRETYQRDVLAEVVDSIMDGEAGPMLAAFVDLAHRAGDEELERLERMVAERRRALGKSGTSE